MNLNKIVVPTDFSDVALNALQFAAELAKKNNSTLYLVNVYNKPYQEVAYNGSLTSMVNSIEDAHIRSEIQKELQEVANHEFLKGIQVKGLMLADIKPWKVTENEHLSDAGLVVMGTSGQTGLIHGGLLGTNTERTIRHSSVPVLSVPAGSSPKAVKKILFATDFRIPLENIFPKIVEFAKSLDAELQVGVINTPNNLLRSSFVLDTFAQLQASSGYAKLKLVEFNAETVEEGINELSQRNNIDMIAMFTHGRTGFAHLLYGSITENVSSRVEIPLLTFKG